jgi:hypothetical protein
VPYGWGCADGNAVGTGGPQELRADEQKKADWNFSREKFK